MMPTQPFMNHLGGGYYNLGQGHDAYHKPIWVFIPQAQYFPGAWGQILQLRLPFLETLNPPELSKLMNDPMSHDHTWPPIPTKLPSYIQNLKVRMVRIMVITLLPFTYGAPRIPLMMILFG
jgi:hypothetical protein